MPMNQDDGLLTPREVAQLLGVRTTTVARWARDGRLDAMLTPGGHRRYRRAAVTALVADDGGRPRSSGAAPRTRS